MYVLGNTDDQGGFLHEGGGQVKGHRFTSYYGSFPDGITNILSVVASVCLESVHKLNYYNSNTHMT